MKRHSPRARYRASLAFAAVVLLFVGTFSHWRAFRLQRRAIFDRLDSVERRLSTFEVPRELPVDPKIASASSGGSAFFHSGDVREAVSAPRPRFLGSGRTGQYLYSDVRLPSGHVNRYYLPATATQLQVKRWITCIVADVQDDVAAFD